MSATTTLRSVDPARASDEDLVRRAQAGDSEAFGELAERHSTVLRRMLYRITRNCDAAMEAVQEAMVRAWRNISRFEGRAKFSTWLTRIGINEAYRGMRAGNRETCLDCDDGPGEALVDPAPGPESVAEAHDLLSSVNHALDELSSDYREAVVLRDVEGLSTREAADSIGIGERALKSRLHRGRRELRARLEEDLDRHSSPR